MSSASNYAKANGIASTPAAVVFVVFYTLCSALWFWKSIHQRSIIACVLFCFSIDRVAAFILRVLLASNNSVDGSLRVYVAYESAFDAGYLGLLLSGFTLALDRQNHTGTPIPKSTLLKLSRSHRLYQILLCIAAACVIYGSVETATVYVSTGNTLRKVGTITFVVLTALLFFQTFMLWYLERRGTGNSAISPFCGARHGVSLLSAICVLLAIREVFLMATFKNQIAQDREAFWYPFVTAPEFLALLIFATPGLIPGSAQNKQPAVPINPI